MAAVPPRTKVDLEDLADIATSGSATDLDAGTVPIPRLGSSGTASGTTYLRGDGAWATPAGGSGIGPAMYVVASSTAPAAIQARADYVCDGTADEVQINAALALGSVWLTDGDFTIATPILVTQPGTTLSGSGVARPIVLVGDGNVGRGFGTRILLASGFAGEAAILGEQTFTAEYVLAGLTFKDFSIDGSGSATANVVGVRQRAFFSTMHNIHVTYMTGSGFESLGNEAPNGAWSVYDSYYTGLRAILCLGDGFNARNNGTDWHMANCTFAKNFGAGLALRSTSNAQQITNVQCYTNWDAGILMVGSGGTRAHLNSCKIQNNYGHGIHADGSSATGPSEVIVNACDFHNNGRGISEDDHELNTAPIAHPLDGSVSAHIYMTPSGECGDWVITGNSFGSHAAYADPTYALNLKSVGRRCVVAGNNIKSSSYATQALNFDGNSTVLTTLQSQGNRGLKDWHGTAAPTPTAGAALGSSPPTPTVDAKATDAAGQVSMGTGTSTTTGAAVTITLAEAFDSEIGYRPTVSAANSSTAALDPYIVSTAAGNFVIGFRVAPTASQALGTYLVNYSVRS